MKLPHALKESIEAGWAGEVGTEWVDRLHSRIARAEQRWNVAIGDPYEPGGITSFVAPATRSTGEPAVYKITIPHDEAVGEAEALGAYGGDGAVRIFEAETGSFEMLLERCSPGDSLWSVDSDRRRLDLACSLMRRLWRPLDEPGPIASLDAVASRWADVTTRRISTYEHPWTPEPVERGIDLLRSLPATATKDVLLHGDFHPGNILESEREQWLVIDPKPLMGDPAFEPVQLLTQRAGRITEPPPPADVETRLVGIAERMGLDPTRVGLWTIARSAEWSMWSWDHGNAVDAAIAYTWARTLDALIPHG